MRGNEVSPLTTDTISGWGNTDITDREEHHEIVIMPEVPGRRILILTRSWTKMTPPKGKIFPENPLKYAKYHPKYAFFLKIPYLS